MNKFNINHIYDMVKLWCLLRLRWFYVLLYASCEISKWTWNVHTVTKCIGTPYAYVGSHSHALISQLPKHVLCAIFLCPKYLSVSHLWLLKTSWACGWIHGVIRERERERVASLALFKWRILTIWYNVSLGLHFSEFASFVTMLFDSKTMAICIIHTCWPKFVSNMEIFLLF